MNVETVLDVLAHDETTESRVSEDITPPQPFRLAAETKKPFEARASHPNGSTRHHSSYKFETDTDTERHFDVELRTIRVHPVFLFWRAQPNEENIRARLIDQIDNLRIFDFVFFKTKVGTICPAHL